MAAVVCSGVSPRSLGDLLKGFGVMAIVGENCPDALFWWDDAFHLVVERPCDDGADQRESRQAIEGVVRGHLLGWGSVVAEAFKPVRGSKEKKIKRQDSKLKLRDNHDRFEPQIAAWARAIALPDPDKKETEPHPLFPAHGQEGSGDYFSQVEKAVEAARGAPLDIAWSLFAEGNPTLKKGLDSGYLFFPEPMKRYATGIAKWVQDRAALSPWCFLLAVRGAVLLRGSLRRLRWGRRAYPAFPFVFEGSVVELGKGSFFRNVEVHLPTWTAAYPRTLAEFEVQMRQFQARLSGRGFAATAAEFRAAVVGRGPGAAFDTFHRFVLEGRRRGQDQRMRQGIPRGSTRVGVKGKEHATLRLMLAPLAETGWFDQFSTDRLRAERARAEEAIHRAVDEPGPDTYRGILKSLWDLNQALVVSGALRRDLEDTGRKPRPLPPLPALLWERALGNEPDPAHQLGRAIGSILGVRADLGVRAKGAVVGPILEHMLPVRWNWKKSGDWTVPKDPPSRPLRWAGLNPLADFKDLFWFRWLDSAELPKLPFAAARFARLADIAALLRGDVNIREVHCLAGLYALLDWESLGTGRGEASGACVPVPPSYAALRLWLELGIDPPPKSRPPRDGTVARLLSLGSASGVEKAVEVALGHLRVNGLPWRTDPRPTGKAVARFAATIPANEAARMLLAVLAPISKDDTLALSRHLWVPIEE
ncbi:type I-U CRISPR-associated protein Csx17 [Chloracidobacterium aggregatum]|uniref:Type I-U CRISPR-associated protein Csx17 n=1 Tax=Chloracidobacterium sp. N TaxID=2821540 RepID=A0ABX8B320_9BACT|nr:type I-U CRISPR-associated protein Csx17 [Chloracidobacterium aggregatum]QUV86481.1 type I-U CRISPR-associated protein Csx17 [Chloracidobacterium sp. 2]QUV89088.1 type I-U CRISPR-associated protein Csx17 [Chloracidobacterium sp. S]QUV92105.1 type I-U CRISPR-associated protein Csx17 [Chloracidobacterium sp. A]QUV95378.1 type I-U CRISPR-associated protein Csx17 [Chloracidobacterium sp. N]QUV98603.1 type I-U CRISPR-associated protein Csx17 [Chloracidobacterium sp. E]